jgi:WD40 repeat protein
MFSFFLTGCYDGVVRMWNASRQCVAEGRSHEKPVKDVCFLSDHQCVSVSKDRRVCWWDMRQNESGWSMDLQAEAKDHESSVEAVAVSPDRQHVRTKRFSLVLAPSFLTLDLDYNGRFRRFN